MKDILTRFRIPTLLGLGIIIFGIAAGIFLSLKNQNFISQAFPDTSAQNITLSNISDDSVTISWQTSQPVISFLTYGIQNPDEATIIDDRDKEGLKAHMLHYITIKNLLPKTTYQYKIISGKLPSEILRFTTSTPISSLNNKGPVIGSVSDANKPIDEAMAFLSIAGAHTQSSLIKAGGNFLIPISQLRKSDLSGGFVITEETTAKLTVISPAGQASVLFKIAGFEKGLPPLSLGENLDLTILIEDPAKYDLNGDGIINSADSAIILQNKGPLTNKTTNPKADINADKIIDQKDLDLLIKKIKEHT